MNFTTSHPTIEGAYWLKRSEFSDPELIHVYYPKGCDFLCFQDTWVTQPICEGIGLWSPRLVSVEEVKLAYDEAISDYFDKRTSNFELSWDESRARQVVDNPTESAPLAPSESSPSPV